MTKLTLRDIEDMQPDPPRRRRGDDGTRIQWPVVAWVLGILVSALVSYNVTSSSYDKRISVLEERYSTITKALDAIQRDVTNLTRTLLTR